MLYSNLVVFFYYLSSPRWFSGHSREYGYLRSKSVQGSGTATLKRGDSLLLLLHPSPPNR